LGIGNEGMPLDTFGEKILAMYVLEVSLLVFRKQSKSMV
jgi:hypothetical protein